LGTTTLFVKCEILYGPICYLHIAILTTGGTLQISDAVSMLKT